MQAIRNLTIALLLIAGLGYGSYAFGKHVLSAKLFGPNGSKIQSGVASTSSAPAADVALEPLPEDGANANDEPSRPRSAAAVPSAPDDILPNRNQNPDSSSSSTDDNSFDVKPVDNSKIPTYSGSDDNDEVKPRKRRRRRRPRVTTASTENANSNSAETRSASDNSSNPPARTETRANEGIAAEDPAPRARRESSGDSGDSNLGRPAAQGSYERPAPQTNNDAPRAAVENQAPRRRRERVRETRNAARVPVETKRREAPRAESPVPVPEGSNRDSGSPVPVPE